MDNRQHYQKIADVDIYDPYVNEGSSQASAPPQSEIYTPLIHSHAQQYSQPQPQQYQTIQMPIPHTYTQEAPTYTYIIRKRGADGRQFPIQASICLLGCLAPPIWFIACCWPSNNRYEIAWRKVNYCMISLLIICFLLFVVFAALFGLEEGHFPETDPGWRIPQLFSIQ